MILTCYCVDKSVVSGSTSDLIIAPLEVHIGKMLIFNRKCLTCLCVAYKNVVKNKFGALD